MTSNKPKITELTPEQKAAIPKYAEMAMRIGLAVDTPDFVYPVDLVRQQTDAHRVMCGLPKAKIFIVHESPFAAQKDPLLEGISASNALFGQHDINWLMHYMFFRIECGLREQTEGIVHLVELAKTTGWMWMCDDITVVTRRPTKLHLSPRATGISVLDNKTGYAIEYSDGTGVVVVGGTRIPRQQHHLVLDRSMDPTLRVQEIMQVRNTEVRTALLETLPRGEMMSALGGTVVHEATLAKGGAYKLLEIELGQERRRYLQGACPSKGDSFYEAVPPDVQTVQQALTWRQWGKIELPYLEPLVRT